MPKIMQFFARLNRKALTWTGILCLLIIIAAVLFLNWPSPQRTMQIFCNALKVEDYSTAYAQLAQEYKNTLPYDTFVARYRSNQGAGKVVGCTVGTREEFLFGTYGYITYTYANGSHAEDRFRMASEHMIFWRLLPDTV